MRSSLIVTVSFVSAVPDTTVVLSGVDESAGSLAVLRDWGIYVDRAGSTGEGANEPYIEIVCRKVGSANELPGKSGVIGRALAESAPSPVGYEARIAQSADGELFVDTVGAFEFAVNRAAWSTSSASSCEVCVWWDYDIKKMSPAEVVKALSY